MIEPRYFRTIAELDAIRDEAAQMSATCPLCSGPCKVREQIHQATRREPARFLGFSGWCVPCQMSFPAEHAQLALA
jgi:hypothetical protein